MVFEILYVISFSNDTGPTALNTCIRTRCAKSPLFCYKQVLNLKIKILLEQYRAMIHIVLWSWFDETQHNWYSVNWTAYGTHNVLQYLEFKYKNLRENELNLNGGSFKAHQVFLTGSRGKDSFYCSISLILFYSRVCVELYGVVYSCVQLCTVVFRECV